MRALVTGGCGFVGSNLIKLLLSKNVEVIIIDNLSSGSKKNIEDVIDSELLQLIEGDILDSELLAKIGRGVDVVFHLAASVGRQKSIDYPILDSETNLIGTLNVLEIMKRYSIPRIIYSSSAAVYGELQSEFIGEDHPLNPDSPYGVSKLAAEKMIIAYAKLYKFSAICLRYFNIYGMGQKFDLYGNVIPIFSHRVYSKQENKITVFGDGLQTRDFVNVIDVARVNYLAALSNTVDIDVFNIGSGTSVTINKLAEKMIELSQQKEVIIEHLPRRIGDVLHCKANVDKARRLLSYNCTIDLFDEKGLAKYLEWFRNSIS